MNESEVLVSDAEVKAEKVLDAAPRRAAKLAEDIRNMRQLRGRLAAALRQTIETHLALLETLSSGGSEEVEAEKVAYLTRPKTS
jgi:cell division initiation protein